MGKMYKNDRKWETMASWADELGVKSWGAEIVQISNIHPYLFMGSRLSAQAVIDRGKLIDQHDKKYDAGKFNVICVASDEVCAYCNTSSKYSSFEIHDRDAETNFLAAAIAAADIIHKHTKQKKHVLVHCHAGRNRAALAILVYCAKYTMLSYTDALFHIRKSNSSRFPMQQTLQNNSFTSTVRMEWDNIRNHKNIEKK